MDEPIRGVSQESGLMCINKSTSWKGLYVAARMNQQQRIYYSVLYGDKDTFFLSYEVLGEPYEFVPWSPFLVGKLADELFSPKELGDYQPKQFLGYSFIHTDMKGRALCLHLVSGKKYVREFLEKDTKLFTSLRSYDPNIAHLDPSPKKLYDVVSNNDSYDPPLWQTDYALGSFEINLKNAYHYALGLGDDAGDVLFDNHLATKVL